MESGFQKKKKKPINYFFYANLNIKNKNKNKIQKTWEKFLYTLLFAFFLACQQGQGPNLIIWPISIYIIEIFIRGKDNDPCLGPSLYPWLSKKEKREINLKLALIIS
jgi:hypothetical protein